MQTFIITFLLMLIVIVIMAVGYILQKKKIKGSCGGISDLGLEKACDCDEPCDKRKELMRRQEKEKYAESQIDIKMIEHQ
ncbi:(Na+)-NQR maturation NqrM [Aliikangiella sp. IMCC44359]|uniref:(Na+)-NQR maturation NqrM n=1 Tax=Aliikangiella sp. IMCC44359 TaxID=3459125 RepID=UPI00403B2CD2